MANTDNIERIDLDKIDWRSSREFFESLGEELDKLDDKDESYNFTWVGKRKSIIEAGTPINKTLRPDMDASKDFDNTKNMLIVGDNLDALKLLQESYLGQIKMIYIDPPYNTGHDFVYHDNFTIKKDDYEDNTTDAKGNRIISEDEFTENSKSNGRFHSDWLSMMYPRLKLARNLLTDNGVIFISIDDSEQENLKKICNEVFGEDNFVGTLVRQVMEGGKSDSSGLAIEHEYCFVYKKNDINGINKQSAQHQTHYTKRDEYFNERGYYYLKPLENGGLGYIASLDYPITGPNNTEIYPGGLHGDNGYRWVWSEAKFKNALNLGMIEFVKSRDDETKFKVYYKIYEKVDTDGKPSEKELPFKTFYLDGFTNRQGVNDLKKIFDKRFFDYPKPLSFIKKTVEIGETKDGYVLDFFAGSGTTGHAVMDLNAEDGGNRKYILVQLDESTDDKSEAKKAGYNTIDQITAERLRRAGDKIIKEHPNLEGKLDTGFRVFRIDSENENTDIRKPLKNVSQTDLFNSIDNIKKDRTPLDLLFGVVYASALPFDLKLETKKIGDNTVYFYGYLDEDSGLVACFDDNISEDTIKEIAKLKPLAATFKDSSFQDSAAKINLSEQFRVIAPDTKVKVI